MFKVKFILVLALLALVVQDEVKCTWMDELMADLVEPFATLIKDADAKALAKTAEKKDAIESGTHTEVADDRSAEIKEAIRTGTLPEREEAILTGTFKEAPIRAATSLPADQVNDAICGTRSTSLSHSILEPTRIVGGTNAGPGDWPWQVGFTSSRGSKHIWCGGTLISNEWIVSAAHCFDPGEKPWVRLGEHAKNTNEGTEQVIQASIVHIHPRYSSKTMDNDIALVRLSKKATINKYVRPACLPSSDFIVKDGTMATISGWGKLSSAGALANILQVAQVPIVNQALCHHNYKKKIAITSTMICAGYQQGGKDSCQGDSGGPLVLKHGTRYFLIGDTSFGIGCALGGYPGVYCRITAVRSWIDSVIPNIAPAPAPPPVPGPVVPVDLLTCNFDKDVCKWKQSTSDQFDWDRRNGGTPSRLTGPTISATGSNGYYMYIETSYPRKQGDAATLISPEVTYATQTCLSFKAHMYGSDIADIRIEKVVGDSTTKIFERSGEQGNKWLSFNVNLPTGGPYKVAITAKRGKSYHGDIAIDELKQTPCGAPPDPLQAASCNFEKDMCKWSQSTADKFDWTRKQGPTPSWNTGPRESSTGPEGYYLFIETSYPRKPGDKATLISPNIRSASKACLMFKAHMYGMNIGTLKIERVEGSTRKTIFSKSGNLGNTWQSYNVDLSAGGPYKVEITGTRGGSWDGDIAIDELLVTQKPCPAPTLPPTTTPAPTLPPTTSPAKGCGNPSIISKITATRVIGGVEATRGCWPWQILMFNNNGYNCGGSLISKDWVVTAAHCVKGKYARNIKIRVGEQDRRKPEGSEVDIDVKRIIMHPRYGKDGHFLNNDIALMQLSRDAPFNQYVKPVSLPKKDVPPGSYCYITGFGKMKHPGSSVSVLQQARLFVPSNKVCDAFNRANIGVGVNGNMICGGDGSKLGGCHGDSGGPFVCDVKGKWELHGAVSWGDRTCNPKKAYTVFARITKYLDWIKQNTGITG